MELPIIKDGSGARIGKSGSKLAFFGATPVVQQAALTAALGGTLDTTWGQAELDELNNVIVRLGEIETALSNLGLIA